MRSIDDTLKDRGSKYGEFKDHAHISQSLKDIMRAVPGWGRLSKDKKETLDMIQHKIGRILNGDPEYLDSWVDIIGYAKLTIDIIEKDNAEKLP